MRKLVAASALAVALPFLSLSSEAQQYHILQRPALTATTIVFNYAGDLWTVDRKGGRAVRLTTGVGLETAPVVSPTGETVAFSGEYDGNTDVFTIPVSGGIPHRVTYHPAADVPVAWTPDGKQIIFRSNRSAHSRYTELFEVSPAGGVATRLPLPLAYQGSLSPDGKTIAYSPIAPAFGFNYTSYVSWGNYHGGEAGTINITDLASLSTVTIPHEKTSDFSPAWLNGKLYFLSARKGAIGLFSYDPGSKALSEVFHNGGPDLHSLSAGPNGLVYDQLGEIYLVEPGGKPHKVEIDVTSDLPEVRERIETVSSEIEGAAISPTGVRAVFEAHGEILTVPARRGPTRDLTNTPGVMERHPVWSPDGQSIAYFSDESGLYALHVAPQTGEGAVKKFPISSDPAYYFAPKWSPDSKKVAFYDNRLRLWILDVTTGKPTEIGATNHFSGIQREYAWSPGSRWFAFTHEEDNHLRVLYLYEVATGKISPVTDKMADAGAPAFDRNGKYLYFTVSTNEGGVSFGLDMTTDLLRATRSVYAAVLASDGASPLAPESDDEKTLAQARERNRDNGDEPMGGQPGGGRRGGAAAGANGQDGGDETAAPRPSMPVTPVTRPIRVDVAGIETRLVALPLGNGNFGDLQTGRAGGFFFLERSGEGGRGGGGGATLRHWALESREASTVSERVASYDVSANGEKILVAQGRTMAPGAEAPAGRGAGGPSYSIINAPANPPAGSGGGAGLGGRGGAAAAAPSAAAATASAGAPLNLADMQIRVDPKAEWRQIYHEVWRVERAYFYDPNLHGVNANEEEKRFEPYVAAIASRTDLNYILQEMLSGFSVGHLRGNGGEIPMARPVAGGLLGADYTITNNRYCFSKLYNGGEWNPNATGPLTQPGLNVHVGDCVVAIDGQDLTAATDIQKPLEGTAGHAITLRIASASGAPHDIVVIPTRSEAQLRNFDWIDENIRKVDQLSGGKLAYVYLPDTAEGGFTNFNRYYYAQTEKQGAIIDERFNSGGQVADYIIESLQRRLLSYWSPRYGAIDRTPNAAIYGPKVMIANEFSGSGGDAMPYLFKREKIGPLVGKRTWGGLVGIGSIPLLMDGGTVTSPSFGQFSPEGTWDVENKGIEPDFPIDQDPKSVAEGHDPQLEKAVSLALEKLATQPPPEPHRPPYPNYHK